MMPADAPVRCADADPEIFFAHPSERVKIQLAKAYCKQCPCTADCLRGAFQIRDQDSIRGGLTPPERRALVRSARNRHGAR